MHPTTETTQQRYLKLSEVCTRYGISKTFIYDSIKKQTFLAPKKLGYMSRWSSNDLLQWEIDNGLKEQEPEADAC